MKDSELFPSMDEAHIHWPLMGEEDSTALDEIVRAAAQEAGQLVLTDFNELADERWGFTFNQVFLRAIQTLHQRFFDWAGREVSHTEMIERLRGRETDETTWKMWASRIIVVWVLE